jgi:hypothetical protein
MARDESPGRRRSASPKAKSKRGFTFKGDEKDDAEKEARRQRKKERRERRAAREAANDKTGEGGKEGKDKKEKGEKVPKGLDGEEMVRRLYNCSSPPSQLCLSQYETAMTRSGTELTRFAQIIVNVNDRMGTKAAIPCYASDRIREFKILVAARIGRNPNEILLKRQGERPFKDHITLGDYGIGNGVQLDLEVDTGD